MLQASPLVGFVGVTDLDDARRFYGGLLGLDLTDESPYALVADVAGTMLRISAVTEPSRSSNTVLGWAVSDIAATVDALLARGITFTCYEGMNQDHRGIWTAPSGAKIAWFVDPDGNNLSLTQFAP